MNRLQAPSNYLGDKSSYSWEGAKKIWMFVFPAASKSRLEVRKIRSIGRASRASRLASAGSLKDLTQILQGLSSGVKRDYLGTREKCTSTSYKTSNMIPPQASNCESPSYRRIATMSAAPVVCVQGRDILLGTEISEGPKETRYAQT